MQHSDLPPLATLWIGEALTGIERLSAQSFLDHGHRLILYSYDPVANVPDGVEQRDAREVYDVGRILRYYGGKGSPSLHSNLFRYQLMAKTDQVWVDLDMIALRPFDIQTDHICGWENEKHLNGAVLRLPATSPALAELLRYGPDTYGRPWAAPWPRRLRWLVSMRGRKAPVTDWPWGSTGPTAVTYYMRKTGEIEHALPVAAFYPIPWTEVEKLIMDNGLSIDDFPQTYGIHLWGKFIHRALQQIGGQPQPGSILAQLMQRHGVDTV